MANISAAVAESTRRYFTFGIDQLEQELGQLGTADDLRALREELVYRIGSRPLQLRARHRVLVADIDRTLADLKAVRAQARKAVASRPPEAPARGSTHPNAPTFSPTLSVDPDERWFREHRPMSTWWIWRAAGIVAAAALAGGGHAMGWSIWEVIWPLLKPLLGNRL